MKFNNFCVALINLLERKPVIVSATASLELDMDSLHMENLATSLADYYKIPFRFGGNI